MQKKRIAIIGMSYRLPGTDTEHLWSDLISGNNLVSKVSPDRWAQETYLHPKKNHPGSSYTFDAGSIGDVSTFDAGFFGISPREAALMDPQQRLLLELSWEAMENAGVKPSSLQGSQCGVYIGIASADYSYRMADDMASIDASVATGNTASIAANRISYIFDLHGPSMAIDTACSSSLVAFHQAYRAILTGETTMALTGGVSLHLHPYGFVIFSKASMLSPTGRCNVFDASGDGYVRSEGAGIFLLKDYDLAVADGDNILAIVANSSVNMDGRKSGLTVPNPKAQAALLTQAYTQAGIDPAEIDYLEAHGTGTAIGDPLETRAIGEALGKLRAKDKPLPIGSIKSNVGHMETASGVAGLLKAIYSLQHRVVPATIGIRNLNPKIDFDELNLNVVRENLPLKKEGKLTIGINSFGFGGANAHIILESPEPVATQTNKQQTPATLPVVLFAKSKEALKENARTYACLLDKKDASAFYDLAWHMAHHRDWLSHRAIVYADNAGEAASALLDFANDTDHGVVQMESGSVISQARGPALIYSGNGSQWEGMGKQLLGNPVFLRTVRTIDSHFIPLAGFSLEQEFAGTNGTDRYVLTEIAQPALFAFQVGVTEILRARGMAPVAVAGHSVGEVAAAWASGALSLQDAVNVIYYRSQCQGQTKGTGQMTAVSMAVQDARQLITQLGLDADVVVAGSNSVRGITVAGSHDGLQTLETALHQQKIVYKRLPLDYAFHSPAMDCIEAQVKTSLAHIAPQQTHTPFISTVTGKQLDGEQLDATYWWQNIRQPVLFKDATEVLIADYANVFAEVGPHGVLRNYISECLKDQQVDGTVIVTGTRHKEYVRIIDKAASQLFISGITPDWTETFSQPATPVSLPHYAWQRERLWHPVSSESMGLLDRYKVHPLLGYSLKQHHLTWENQLDTLLVPMLADHVVGDSVVFPGTGFAELGLAAAMAHHPGTYAEIEELEIRAPLILSDEQTKLIRLAIQPADGSFTIQSREYAESPIWTDHAVGRILKEPGDLLLQSAIWTTPVRQPDFTGHDHQQLTRAAGLDYGPAFSCISHGWIEGQTVLAALALADDVRNASDTMYLHPAVLDCTFQLIIQQLKERLQLQQDVTFVPTKLGRLVYRNTGAEPAFAIAKINNASTHSITGEFTVFDIHGVAIASAIDVRFHGVRLNKGSGDLLGFLDYHATPVPHPSRNNAATALVPADIHAAVNDFTKRASLNASYRRYTEEIEPLLDSLCSAFVIEALQTLAGDQDTLTCAQWEQWRQQTSHAHNAWIEHLLLIAEKDQIISRADDQLHFPAASASDITAADIWNGLVADYPDYFQLIHTVGRIGMHLPDFITGKYKIEDIFEHTASFASLYRQSLGAVSKQQIGVLLQGMIKKGLAALPAGQRLHVLEISEDTPAFATAVCLGMDFNIGGYTFASANTQALDDAQRMHERFPSMEAVLLTDDTPSVTQHQLAFITLNFPTRQAGLQALTHAKASLASGGTLIILAQHPSRWMDFTYGGLTTPGHDDVSPLLNQEDTQFWQAALLELGFDGVQLFELSPNTATGTYLLIASQGTENATQPADTTQLPRSWVVLADATGHSADVAEKLSKKLLSHGDMVVHATPANATQFGQLLSETTSRYGKLDGIIHLSGISSSALPGTTEQLFQKELDRCAMAASVIQACEATGTETTFWIVTQDAAAHMLDDYAQQPRLSSDAALLGYGRTLINEASNYTVRLVDINTTVSLDNIIDDLYTELNHPDDEQEIILSAHHARYAPRLRAEPRPAPRVEAQNAENIHLNFQFPGQLRNLRWEAVKRQPLAEGHIEVQVHATGLNFRDVMYALGLLSDEAIENGFAGPTLGLEFAGVVTQVNAPDSGYKIGDKVVGFGPSSFANHVVTQISAVSHIPAGINFEAAATIPSTFFTVYYALHYLAHVREGEKVLIHGAAGGVGIAAIQLCKWLGAEIYATAGSDEKRDFLKLMGVDHIYDSRSLSFADEILLQTEGQGVDVVLNSLAGEAINRNFRVLKPFGRFLELGKRDFYENTKVGLRPFRNNLSYFGIDADQLMNARPDLTRTLFAEVMDLFAKGILHPLPYAVFDAENIIDAFRYMQQARQIGKIVITYHHGIHNIHRAQSALRAQLDLPEQATYLVTGGLKGFGLRTAEWLAEKGARHLILLSRSGPGSAESVDAIQRLEAQGVHVHAVACDITNKQAVTQLLKETRQSMPPLKGIVHAATVIDDGLVRHTTKEQISHVLGPKMLGALYLHELTTSSELDFFVFFSSATTLFGNPGQSNYVAGNLFMENLASYRLSRGLPATCVRWGAIDDVGFLARNDKIKDALQNRMGGSALQSETALAVLEDMLLSNTSGLGVMETDWKMMSRFLPSMGSPKFSEVVAGSMDHNDVDDSADLQRMLEELSDEALALKLIDMLRVEVGEILRVAPDKIDPEKSIYDMGLDSLMGVELVVALESRFGVRLPVMALSDNPTATKLADYLISKLKGSHEEDAPEDQLSAKVQTLSKQHGVDLSEESAQALAKDIEDSSKLSAQKLI